MKKYRIRPVNLHDGNHLCEKAEPPCETVVTLADAKQYAEEARKDERKRIREWCNRNDLEISGKKVMDAYEEAIRSRGAEPAKLEKLGLIENDSSGLARLGRKVNEIIDAIESLRKGRP